MKMNGFAMLETKCLLSTVLWFVILNFNRSNVKYFEGNIDNCNVRFFFALTFDFYRFNFANLIMYMEKQGFSRK